MVERVVFTPVGSFAALATGRDCLDCGLEPLKVVLTMGPDRRCCTCRVNTYKAVSPANLALNPPQAKPTQIWKPLTFINPTNLSFSINLCSTKDFCEAL
jgi:hypothetical protein